MASATEHEDVVSLEHLSLQQLNGLKDQLEKASDAHAHASRHERTPTHRNWNSFPSRSGSSSTHLSASTPAGRPFRILIQRMRVRSVRHGKGCMDILCVHAA